jgi:hypothetical protein
MSIEQKRTFQDDPTDFANASFEFERTRALAHVALANNNADAYWEYVQWMKLVGSFLPITDTRNPHYSAQAPRQQG